MEWRTGSEFDNAGFHIQRSHPGAHGFERITGNLIPATGSTSEGAEYNYEYLDVTAGST